MSLFHSGPPPPPPGWVFVVSPLGPITELDVLFTTTIVLTCVHAELHGGWKLVLAGLGLGLVTETVSLRLGGTHFHASGHYFPDFFACSSGNTVLFYVSWVYVGITSARRLVDERSWAFPFMCGLLFLGTAYPTLLLNYPTTLLLFYSFTLLLRDYETMRLRDY